MPTTYMVSNGMYKAKAHLQGLRIDDNIILKLILRILNVRIRSGIKWIGLGCRRAVL
jgi:hypothetical protein